MTTRAQKYLEWMLNLYNKQGRFYGKTNICKDAHVSNGAFTALQNHGFIENSRSGFVWVGQAPDLDLAEEILKQGNKCQNSERYGSPRIDHSYGKVYGRTPVIPDLEKIKEEAREEGRQESNLQITEKAGKILTFGFTLGISAEKMVDPEIIQEVGTMYEMAQELKAR